MRTTRPPVVDGLSLALQTASSDTSTSTTATIQASYAIAPDFFNGLLGPNKFDEKPRGLRPKQRCTAAAVIALMVSTGAVSKFNLIELITTSEIDRAYAALTDPVASGS
jgi:hypothetical protein